MFRIGRWPGALLFVLTLFFGASSAALADILEISSNDINDIYKIDLAEGEFGDLTIYLKSFGDELEGYAVNLLDDLDRQVAFEKSTPVGIVRFSGIPPGRYRIRVESKRSIRGVKEPVTVGDMKLLKATVPVKH